MKVIDVLNKIANGEKDIKFTLDGCEYSYSGGMLKNASMGEDAEWFIYEEWLNEEVEIIKEDKKIKKLNYRWEETEGGYEICDEELVNKINEIIDYLNKGDKE